jgi:hypothetical protein
MKLIELSKRGFAPISTLTKLKLHTLLDYYSEEELNNILDYRSHSSHRLSRIAEGGGRYLPIRVILEIEKLTKAIPPVTNSHVLGPNQ